MLFRSVALQESTFEENEYQEWRSKLISICHGQVLALNLDLFSVKLKLKYVEKYKLEDAFKCLSESDKGELINEIAPLVFLDDSDEAAKRYDNFMYGLMLANIDAMPSFKYAKKQLCDIAFLLEKKISIPQVKIKLPLIKQTNTEIGRASCRERA